MKRLVLAVLVILASASIGEAQVKKPLGCTVMVEVADFVDPDTGKDSAAIDRIWTKGKTKCESKGKVKFFLNNTSDIAVTVILKNFQTRVGDVCTGGPTGGATEIPIDKAGVMQIKLTASAGGDGTDKRKIRNLGTTAIACYKFDVYLYRTGTTINAGDTCNKTGNQIDCLDPDLEIGPPSGPPPVKASGR